ncbi:winged helix-turn-helix domain-containing protein [Thalassotalea marina]|uniref:OmpR/PhoB-type domain-containing protein n=1 Tax=Thalassotalea marina TaxID=1673741 RepID=A0A919BPM3_9GAMM|nr:winged helix-turn-helix domain-containing protein [Thalassotalea marina]GHG04786.1 hypothetical protein GCM10017161_38010 [Thalassotalea marina]
MEPFKLGNWHVSPKLNQLTLMPSGKIETVTPKIMALLTVLKEQGSEPANVEQLISKVWHDRIVADSSVYQAIAQLRKVLNQDAEHALYIERISGQGYRISPEITISPIIEISDKADVEVKNQNKVKPILILFGLLVITFVVVWLVMTSDSSKETQSQHFESLTLAKHLTTKTEPGSLHHAKQLYLSVLRESPNNAEALNGLCNSYRLLAIYDTMTEAERDSLCQPLLDKAFELQPDNALVIASMAQQSYEQDNIKQAKLLFKKALSITEKEASIWHWYGQLMRSQNEIESALDAHQNAFRLAPNDPIVLRGLAYAYLNNRDLDNARKYFERSIVIAPKFKNRALYELDFYSLNQERAQHYLTWSLEYNDSYLQRFPVHRLSYVIFLLSLNQIEVAEDELSKVEALETIPQHFLLYTKASIAWHKQQPEEAIKLLKQRYLLSPEKNHLVMPYLLALVHTDQGAKALELFEHHFANIIELETIQAKHLGQYLLLASLYQSTDMDVEYKQAYAKLLRFRQEQAAFPDEYELLWYELNGNQTKIYPLLMQMIANGWIPDYNDNMFTTSHYLNLINTKEQQSLWLNALQQTQQCIWQRRQCQ